jgi:hypothetical protein
MQVIRRFSSRRQRLDRSFLAERLKNARGCDRIAGYFSSSPLELVSWELDSVSGPIRVICNSDLDPLDVQTAKAARDAIWRSWTGSRPEALRHPLRSPPYPVLHLPPRLRLGRCRRGCVQKSAAISYP